jgi:nucleoside phosphorylase
MKVLVTFAVEAEFAPWRSRHEFHQLSLGTAEDGTTVHVYEARIGSEESISTNKVWAFLTGVGWGNAKHAFRKVLSAWPTYCISSGLAGGLKDSYRKGDVVVARRVGSLGTNLWVEGHRPMVRAAVDCGARLVESCLTTDCILASSQQKVTAGHHGDIVEMESYHLLAAASGKKIPAYAVIRAISDTVQEDLPIDFGKVADNRGRLRYGNLIREIGRRPQRIPALIEFGLGSRRAANSLADFLDRYIPAIQHGTDAWSNEHFEKVAVP